MSPRGSRSLPARVLAEAIAGFQAAVVIPHCAECSKPCCRLDPLVLELDWQRLKPLWQIEESRAAFDRRLASGRGPTEIRAGNGLYYIHGKTCPAYDETQRSCRVYGLKLKPAGCTDFPVYLDQDCVIADLRCEALDLDVLVAWIARSVGPEYRVVRRADAEFPCLVTLSLKRVAGTASAGKRPRSSK